MNRGGIAFRASLDDSANDAVRYLGLNMVSAILSLVAMLLQVGFAPARPTFIEGASVNASAPADLLEHARAGAWACFRPRLLERQCNSIERYTFQGGQAIEVHAEVMISRSPTTIMSVVYPATIRSD